MNLLTDNNMFLKSSGAPDLSADTSLHWPNSKILPSFWEGESSSGAGLTTVDYSLSSSTLPNMEIITFNSGKILPLETVTIPRRKGEGSRPIFDRTELTQSILARMAHDEEEVAIMIKPIQEAPQIFMDFTGQATKDHPSPPVPHPSIDDPSSFGIRPEKKTNFSTANRKHKKSHPSSTAVFRKKQQKNYSKKRELMKPKRIYRERVVPSKKLVKDSRIDDEVERQSERDTRKIRARSRSPLVVDKNATKILKVTWLNNTGLPPFKDWQDVKLTRELFKYFEMIGRGANLRRVARFPDTPCICWLIFDTPSEASKVFWATKFHSRSVFVFYDPVFEKVTYRFPYKLEFASRVTK